MSSSPQDQPDSATSKPQDSSSSAARTRAYRQRLRDQGLERAIQPPCQGCGRPINLSSIRSDSPRGRSATGSTLCAPCWRKTDEGRASERERNRNRQRDRSKRRVLGQNSEGEVGI